MRVVLAGGGTAGHIEPALALADALRRDDPDVRIVCLGTERGLETRLVPQRGYELALIPPVPAAADPDPAAADACPAGCAGAINAAAAVLDRAKADVLVGFGGYVATPGYLAARRRKVPIIVHEAEPPARPGQPARRAGSPSTSRSATPTPRCRTRASSASRCAARSPRSTGSRVGDKARAALRAAARPADAAGLRRVAGRALAQPRAVGAAAPRCARPASRCCTSSARRTPSEPEPAAGGPPYIMLPYCDRMDLAYAAADFAHVPGRRDDLRRADRGRPARGVRPAADRQRRAAAERRADRRGAAAACWSRTPS